MANSVELRGRVRDWYFNNLNSTIVDAAEEFHISYETVKSWSDEEGWVTKKEAINNKPTEDVIDQASEIRNVIFQRIIGGEMDPSDLSELVKAWKSMTEISTSPVDDTEYFNRDDIMELISEAD